ncbi:MAG: ptrB [Gemmatimonadetes bacterium]|nr:ptrB [Gemmatimonadota bacterium]
MRRTLAAFALFAAPFVCVGAQSATQAGRTLSPPVATRVPKADTLHGDIRIDDYAWLRDDARKRPEVISYLEAENAYTEVKTAALEPLRQKLYAEFLGRIKQTDLQVPEPYGPYLYYSRTVEGKQYPIFARKRNTPNANEEILLDRNERAGTGNYYATGAMEISPDHRLLAVLEDRNGSEHFVLRVKDLTTGKWLADSLLETTYGVEWANDNKTLFYTRFDSAQRPDRIFRHHLGDDPAKDVIVAREPDDLFNIEVAKSRSGRYLFIKHGSFTSAEVKFLDAAKPDGEWRVIVPRTPDLEYDVEHHDGRFIIRTNADGATNFKLVTAPVSAPDRAHWKDWIAPRADVQIESFIPFKDHYVLVERSNALERLRILDATTNSSHYVTMPESVYSAGLGGNREYSTSVVRYRYTSLVTPSSVYDYDMRQRRSTLRKQEEVVGGYDKSKYATERAWARAEDGAMVPLSIVYKKPLVRDGKRPMLLYAYGSYGYSTDPNFSTNNLSLLDRGVVYAIAHIRGGQEMGRKWYDDGKMMKKKNTFTDFIAAAEYLERERYTSKERLAIRGGSAGGLLMGAVTNMRPDLFKAVVADVPFVDVINTMLDASIPLTTGEWLQWGNPKEPAAYAYMKSYSPYDNVAAKAYPSILVTTGLNDPRVGYWEPAKWVAKLRATKTDSNLLVMRTNMGAGHGGSSGRYDALKDNAFRYAFVLDQIGATGLVP